MNLNYPRTRDEWWDNVDKAWKDLYNILNMFLPLSNYEKIIETDLEGAGFVDMSDVPMHVTITKAKEDKDPILAHYFEAAWEAAPDDSSIRSIPGWFVLCDLCSESYVLFEEQEDVG